MADKAQGTVISWAATTIPNVQSIGGPAGSNPTVDVSDLSDTARAKISSALFDGGQITVNVHFEPDNAVHQAIIDAVRTGTSGAVVITFADGGTTVYTVNAFPTEATFDTSLAEALGATFTFDINGDVGIT